MGVRAGGGVEAAVASRQKWDSSVFWAMTNIWADELIGVSNIAVIHIERAPANFQCWVNSYKNDLCTVELMDQKLS